MTKLLWIGTGGFIGAVLRYLISAYIQDWTKSIGFPYGTLAVNLAGCVMIGLFSQIAETRGAFTAEARNLLFIGLLGAFTTFSTFSNETMSFLEGGKNSLALANIGSHLILGLVAVRVGQGMALMVWK